MRNVKYVMVIARFAVILYRVSILKLCFFLVTVADYADADPAVVKSGRLKKAVANAVEKEGKCYKFRRTVI